MNDTQILTVAISVVFPIVALIYSHVASKDRFGDLVQSINKQFATMEKRFDAMEKRFDAMEKHTDEKIDNAFGHIELLLKLHEAEHHHK